LLERGIIDGIIKEPEGGAHLDFDMAAALLGDQLRSALAELRVLTPRELVERRYQKFRRMAPFFSE
jgi:acetyl-CoA carboxylase carboxyl transferase subunit alpha